jgi:hypothetical protein
MKTLFALLALCIPAIGQVSAPPREITLQTSIVDHLDGITPIELATLNTHGQTVDVYADFGFQAFYAAQNRMPWACQNYTSITGATLRANSLGTPDVVGQGGFCNAICGGSLGAFTGNIYSYTDFDHVQNHSDAHGMPMGVPAMSYQYIGRFYGTDGPIRLSMTGYRFMQEWNTPGHPWNYNSSGHNPYSEAVLRYDVSTRLRVVPVNP